MKFDVVIIGGGGAGMMSALEASKSKDLSVAIFTKTYPTRSHTGAAQGGINASLGFQDEKDSVDEHFRDTVKGSDFLGDQDAIEFFVSKAPECILELESLGLPFSRDEKGRIAQRNFGGASHPRTCYSADKTGHVILHNLFEQCLKNNVHFFNEWALLEIVTDKDELQGVIVFDIKSGEINSVNCKSLIITTGGFGRIYWSRTTNAYNMTGDGTAICLEAGIPIKDPEFVQFHPTGLITTGVLLSEACRGEGGYLVNNQGERFMEKYAPEKMELAPRDLVSRSIEQEIKEGRGFGEGLASYVHLDLRHLGKKKILEKLPQVRQLAIEFEGVDMIDEPAPIRPSGHYVMGGIHISDYQTCATPIAGIHAAGECACVSVHGANRLGGNSLAEAVVFGKFAGKGAAQSAKNRELGQEELIKEKRAKWEKMFTEKTTQTNGKNLFTIRDNLAQTMWNNVGIFRKEEEIEKALSEINQLLDDYKEAQIGDDSKKYNMAFITYLEVGNLLKLAKAITMGALARKESRGSHARMDYPKRDDENFLKHTLVYKNGEEYKLDYLPVKITKYQPEERKY
ncbi:succinate dehydrogenase subunit A [Desulfonispora thiosulfatigenes DSM 11270]|uniref:succinate dehydrogenase n=1 Tax=Desulfonispora thiosulfatigenes DSM 11270 TaxID=656914 RepID=A0A1W1V3H8_DESTI|nr:FAD-binding protein [Desulfonispora thiosulfatigenes]SMB87601.1 succinate dehydrogenase subunit A [Desulfonispora thiosulfatigenes DSM 11270]